MLLKNLLVFIHLIAMALAVGKMLEFDLRFMRQAHRPPDAALRRALQSTQTVMSVTLALLWLSGLALVAWAWEQDANALLNEKLWVKVLTVCILTLNGVLMHRMAFPLLRGGQAFLALPLHQVLGLGLCGVVSSVSWLYASFLGIARSWNHSTPFGHVFGVYLALLLMAALGTLIGVLVLRVHTRARPRSPSSLGAPVMAEVLKDHG
jgi:hypothetical protein